MILDRYIERMRLPPFRHQVVGIQAVATLPVLGLFDTMGLGKTKQVIDGAQILAHLGIINKVVVIAPASVRSVWFDPELGELVKHLWVDFSSTISEFHSNTVSWDWFIKSKKEDPKLRWIITNYEFIRSKSRLLQLAPICDQKTLLVLDESSAVKSYRAQQSIACYQLRQQCGRVVLLNGTPIANNPGDLFQQAYIMDKNILACKSWFHFRARYGIMGGWQGKQIIQWRDLPDLQKRLAPYVIRRLKEDCIDLPPKLDSVIRSVALTETTWKSYKQMRDDMVTWLSDESVSSAQQAIVKTIRLAQITSGFIGGVSYEMMDHKDSCEYWNSHDCTCGFNEQIAKPLAVEEVGREKLDYFLEWLTTEQLEVEPNTKLLVWCRFRPEVHRLYEELKIKQPKIVLGKIWGGQKTERNEALRLLDPRTMPKGPVIVIGTPASGSMGLNLTGAHTVVYLSNDYSLKTRLQSEDRVHRPGQTFPVSYFDIIATGPGGQKTIDHAIIRALRNKEEVANWTTSAWIQALTEE